ncbi:MAG: response regulator [Phycisphaerales bacterium]|nr:response regulator [Phycisphaerales bacterium]
MPSRVLVVDDALFMRHMIKNILSEMGHEVVGEAADGEEACRLYDQLKPDITTMDLVMPNVGGLDALKRIREKDPNAKVVVISALDQRQPLMDALKHGAADYVVKPFEKDRVEEAIKRVIAG